MKLILLAVLFGLALAQDDAPLVNKEFLDGYNKFSSDLYKEVSHITPKNFVISPISADIVLALAEYGSAGETSKQLVKGLSLPENKEKIREAMSAFTPKLNVYDKFILTSANKVYVKQGWNLLEDFKKMAVEVYNTEVQNINFEQSEAAANEINKWVEDNTKGNIKNLIEKDQLSGLTRTVFLNALFFKGTWVTKFNPTETKKLPFHLPDGTTTELDFMSVTNKFKFYENRDLKAKFLELPYDGEDVTMTLVLPNEKDGLPALEEKIFDVLTSHKFHHRKVKVQVRIPRFEIQTKLELNDVLKKLGIVNAFDDSAEFPKITGEDLSINKVLQSARIEVNEEGTTAAAASSVDEISRSAHVLSEEFIADHSFLFVLKYKSVILFIGHFTGTQ